MFDLASGVQTENNDNQSDSMIGKTPAQWGDIFKSDLVALKKIHDAFKAMNYIIMNLFPAMEGYTTAVMGTEAVAMQAVSNALKQLNSIKADFNSCQDPSYWDKNLNSNKLYEKIDNLVKEVQTDPALKGVKSTVIEQLQVITHASANPGMWTSLGPKNDPTWTFHNEKITWWSGQKLIQNGSLGSYLKWIWTQEWEGKSTIPKKDYSFYEITLVSVPTFVNGKRINKLMIDIWHTTPNGMTFKTMPYKEYETFVSNTVRSGQPIFEFANGVKNLIFLKGSDGNNNGKVIYWDGTKWIKGKDGKGVSEQDYIEYVDQKIDDAIKFVHKGGPGSYLALSIAQVPPTKPDYNPQLTTGTTTQAFAAISTTLNSQSSVAQSKFKYLQSNEQEFLGIQHGTMSQIVKVEETMTRQMATH